MNWMWNKPQLSGTILTKSVCQLRPASHLGKSWLAFQLWETRAVFCTQEMHTSALLQPSAREKEEKFPVHQINKQYPLDMKAKRITGPTGWITPQAAILGHLQVERPPSLLTSQQNEYNERLGIISRWHTALEGWWVNSSTTKLKRISKCQWLYKTQRVGKLCQNQCARLMPQPVPVANAVERIKQDLALFSVRAWCCLIWRKIN